MEQMKRAVIIAAGEGVRLRPLTEMTPKPLVKVNGVRMIDTAISALKENKIHEIYIVTGYKKEQFYEIYGNDPDIHILENPHYKEGNNITSLYAARDCLEDAFIIEGDLLIKDRGIFAPEAAGSAYCACHMEQVPEWALKQKDGRIVSCDIAGGEDAWRNLGISLWTREDGQLLGRLIRECFEQHIWNIYWDEIPLALALDRFHIGIREVAADALTEIDTLDELAAIDAAYESWIRKEKE